MPMRRIVQSGLATSLGRERE